jgi:lysophospholipase L1-like esterase
MPIAADIVMLGDSLTAMVDWNELFPAIRVANRGIPGDTVKGMLNRLGPILAAKPKRVFVMGGVNDILGGAKVDRIAEDYRALVELISESGIRVIVQSTLFTGEPKINRQIGALNGHLSKLCQEVKCKYIDLNTSLAPNGRLQSSVDGIHITFAGYRLWRDAIAEEIAR